MRGAESADHSAGSGRAERLQHRLTGADTFEDGVGTEPVGELLDAGDASVASLGHDLGGAELASQVLARGSMT